MAGFTLEGSLGLNPVTEPKMFRTYNVDATNGLIYKNAPVMLDSDGFLVPWAAGTQPVGVAMEHVAANSGGTCVVCVDPEQEYEIACDGAWHTTLATAIANRQAAMDNEWFSMALSGTAAGQSTAQLDQSTSGAFTDGTDILKIVGLAHKPGNVNPAANVAGHFVRVKLATLFHSMSNAAPAS